MMMLGAKEGRLYDLNVVDYDVIRFVAAISFINSSTLDHRYQAATLSAATLNDRFLLGVKAYTGDAFPGNGVPFFGLTNNLDSGASKLFAGGSGADLYGYQFRGTNYFWQSVATSNDGSAATEEYVGVDGFGYNFGKHDGALHDGDTTGGAAMFIALEFTVGNKGLATQTLTMRMKVQNKVSFESGDTYSVAQLHAFMDSGAFGPADDAGGSGYIRDWVTPDGGSAALPLPSQIMVYNPFSNPRMSLSGFACRIS